MPSLLFKLLRVAHFSAGVLLSCQRQILALNYVHGTHCKPQARIVAPPRLNTPLQFGETV